MAAPKRRVLDLRTGAVRRGGGGGGRREQRGSWRKDYFEQGAEYVDCLIHDS